jgi:hypothetical protein
MSEQPELSTDPSSPPPPLNLSGGGGTFVPGHGLSLGLQPLNLSYTCLSIEEKVQTDRYKKKVESELAESGAIAMALREEIREENGIEPGSTPTIGNSGERIVIKSPRARQMSASSFEGGGGGGEYLNELPPEIVTEASASSSASSSISAPPSVSSIKKTLSFGHLEIKKIIKITEDDHHKGEGHHSPTVFEGFCKSEAKRIKIESLSPSPASSPMPAISLPKTSKED